MPACAAPHGAGHILHQAFTDAHAPVQMDAAQFELAGLAVGLV